MLNSGFEFESFISVDGKIYGLLKHCYHWYEDRGLPLPECLPHNRVQSCRACCIVWHYLEDEEVND